MSAPATPDATELVARLTKDAINGYAEARQNAGERDAEREAHAETRKRLRAAEAALEEMKKNSGPPPASSAPATPPAPAVVRDRFKREVPPPRTFSEWANHDASVQESLNAAFPGLRDELFRRHQERYASRGVVSVRPELSEYVAGSIDRARAAEREAHRRAAPRPGESAEIVTPNYYRPSPSTSPAPNAGQKTAGRAPAIRRQ